MLSAEIAAAGCLLPSTATGGANVGMEKSDLGAEGSEAGVGPGSETAGMLFRASDLGSLANEKAGASAALEAGAGAGSGAFFGCPDCLALGLLLEGRGGTKAGSRVAIEGEDAAGAEEDASLATSSLRASSLCARARACRYSAGILCSSCSRMLVLRGIAASDKSLSETPLLLGDETLCLSLFLDRDLGILAKGASFAA